MIAHALSKTPYACQTCTRKTQNRFSRLKITNQETQSLLTFAKNIVVVLIIGFASANILTIMGYGNLLAVSFSMALTLMASDGFLTSYILKNGGYEANPIMNFLNKKITNNNGILLSRIIGLFILSVGLLTRSPYLYLAIAWMFCIVICLNSIALATSRPSDANINSNIKNTSNNDDECPNRQS